MAYKTPLVVSTEDAAITDTPERQLVAAVIDRAIRDALGMSEKRHRNEIGDYDKRNAICWIFDEPLWDHQGLSFVYCCEILEIDIAILRKQIQTAIENSESDAFNRFKELGKNSPLFPRRERRKNGPTTRQKLKAFLFG